MLEEESRYYMMKGLDGKWSIHTSMKLYDPPIKKDLTEEEALMWLKLLKEN